MLNRQGPLQAAIQFHNKIRATAHLPQLCLEKADLPPVHIMHDHLRFLAESEAYRVLKLRAERGMGQALSTGFCVLAIVNLELLDERGNASSG